MKDAKGHGSNKRGSGYDPGPVPQGKVFAARQAAKAANSTESWEARYGTQADRDRLQADAINAGVDAGFKTARSAAGLSGSEQKMADHAGRVLGAINSMGGQHPKSEPVETHPSMGGKFGPFASAVAGFREKYGAPRGTKAEARGFASGKREINRLKSQGK